MWSGGEYIYEASLAAASFVHDGPVDVVEMCSNSAQVYTAVGSLMYRPSTMKQVCCCFTVQRNYLHVNIVWETKPPGMLASIFGVCPKPG